MMIVEFACYVVWLLAFQIFLLLFQVNLIAAHPCPQPVAAL